MATVTCIEDLRELARKRVARAIFEYVDCGSYTECTLRANQADIEAIALRQRVGIDVDNRSTRTTMLGREVAMPAALAPIGLLGLNWANGEILAARAAQQFGIPFTLSTMSICSIEDVAQADRLDVGAVGAQRAFAVGAAVDVLEDGARDALPGHLAKVVDAGHHGHGGAFYNVEWRWPRRPATKRRTRSR